MPQQTQPARLAMGHGGRGCGCALALLLVVVGLVAVGSTSPGTTGQALPTPAGHSTPPPSTASPRPSATAAPSPVASSPAMGSALRLLGSLPVKGRAPATGYSRAQFGQAWADVDRNGCDTRNDVLRRDLSQVVVKAGTRGCVVASGVLADPYSGTRIAFVRGVGTSTQVQVDHVVPEGLAWQTGAQQLGLQQRTNLANDPLNLLAVAGRLNEAKGDADAASWLPPNKAYRCAYVARQVTVKAKYHLWVTAPEKAAMVQVLQTCPGQGVPTSAPIPLAPAATPQPAAPTSRTTPAAIVPATARPTPARSTGASVHYANCAQVKAAGAAPLRRGQPGYRPGLDQDHDGVACEA